MLEHKQEMAQFAEHQQRGGGRKHNSLQMKRGEWASGHWAARVGEVVHQGCKLIQKLDQDNNIQQALLWNSTSKDW